eukprot:1155052-Pelagomonas_calceolata.AAC.2
MMMMQHPTCWRGWGGQQPREPCNEHRVRGNGGSGEVHGRGGPQGSKIHTYTPHGGLVCDGLHCAAALLLEVNEQGLDLDLKAGQIWNNFG